MSTINRPIAGNYNAIETSRKALSAKADSVFSYRNVNPYSIAFDKFRREGNENFREDLWTQASNKGELDQYINLLISNPKKSSKLTELTDKYADRVDYDTAMLALSYDAIKDDVAEERYDSAGNSLGKMTQRELMDKVFANQEARWEMQIAEDAKKSRTFWEKAAFTLRAPFAQEGANMIDRINGINRGIQQYGNYIHAGVMTLIDRVEGKVKTDKEIIEAWVSYASNRYINDPQLNIGGARGDNALSLITKANEAYEQAAYDIRRKYTYSVDPTTGEYNWWGKIMHGMSDSIGYMAVSMAGGGPAAMYLPMFTQNVIENVQMTGYNTDYTKLMTNAGIKTGIEYAIELALGKLIGFSKLDKLIGYSDDALRVTQQTVTKGITATSKEAAKQWALATAKDMFKEGLEEVLQDMSGMAIDYMYGDDYKARSKEEATLENFGQAFIVGAATSLVIGSFTTMTTKSTIGVDKTGLTYTMGKFQTYTYKQALSTLNSWQEIANDAKADPNDRITAALKLDGVTASLGSLYESLGLENTVKAEKLLLDMQAYHDKKITIKDSVAKGTYVKDLMSGLTAETNGENEVGGNKWLKAFNTVNAKTTELFTNLSMAQNQGPGKVFESFAKSLQKAIVQQKLQDSGATKIETPIDLTDNTQIIPESIRDIARRLGFNILVKTDGKDIIIDDDVIFTPLDIEDSDTQSLIKAVATQKTIMNIAKAMPASLLKAVIDTYKTSVGTATGHYTEATLEQQAIAALMFDKNFQLKMLLQSHKNNNSWGTEQVIDFIKNLKKHIAKTYTMSTTEKTESGKPKRVLSDITKNITERVVKSLQDSIVVFNLTVARSTTYNAKKDKVAVDESTKEALRPEQTTQLENDLNIKFSSILDDWAANRFYDTPQVNQLLINIANNLMNPDTSYEKLRTSIMKQSLVNSKPTVDILVATMRKILLNGTKNQRTDLVASITRTFHTEFSSSKLVYIPRLDSNLHLFTEADKIVANIEKTLLGGQKIADVIEGTADLQLVSAELMKDGNDFITNEVTRYNVIDTIIKRQSSNQFAILPKGNLIKLSMMTTDMVASIGNAKTTEELVAALDAIRASSKDGLIHLRDIFNIELGPVGETVVAITIGLGLPTGYHNASTNVMVLKLDAYGDVASNLALLSHETIHAVNALELTDIRTELVGSTVDSIESDFNPAINKQFSASDQIEIYEYIHTNFPILSATISSTSTKNFLGKALYMLMREENSARSLVELYDFSALGFHYKVTANDEVRLVSPDGSKSWLIKKFVPHKLVDIDRMKAALSSLLNGSEFDVLVQAVLDAGSLEDMQRVAKELAIPAIEAGAEVRYTYTILRERILDQITADNPNVDQTSITDILKKQANTDEDYTASNVVKNLRVRETASTSIFTLESLIKELTDIATGLKALWSEATLSLNLDLAKAAYTAYTMFTKDILQPIRQEALSMQLLSNTHGKYIPSTTPPLNNGVNSIKQPSNKQSDIIDLSGTGTMGNHFNFGEYSLVKYTGRSYMLTKQEGSRSITQEVDMQTLLPVRNGQKPLLDQAMRDRMRFVIDKKIEAAKKAATEPKLPVPEKKTKAVDEVVWEWGPWQVKNYDDNHYVISKNIDKESETGDETGDFSRFAQTQIVSKKTLLPETMLGATGKPILSPSERHNLLNWLKHNNTPYFRKKKQPDGTIKRKYFANLVDESPIVVGRLVEYKNVEYRIDKIADDGLHLKDTATNAIIIVKPAELQRAWQNGEADLLDMDDDTIVNQPSFVSNESAIFEAPRAKRTYISQTRAKKSNLIYLFNRAKAKGQLFQPHDDVVAFVEATTDNFDQLSQFFKVRIKNGTLTRHDITEYIANTQINKINEYTWKAITKYIYKNEALEAIGPAVAEFLIDTARLEKLAIIARMTTDEAQANRVHTLASFKQLMNQFDLMIKKNDHEFIKRYEKVRKQLASWWAYDAEGKLIKDEYIMEQNQIFPIFMSLFRGSLKSINDVFTYAKVVSGKQNQMSVRDNTGSADSTDDNANKTTKISSGNAAVENNNIAKEKNKGPYNWQAHIRKNVINYEITGYAPAEIEEEFTTIEEMTADQKYNLIYEYLYEDALSYLQAGKKPSEQEQSEAHNEVVEIMDEMSEEQILSTIRYILDEKINAIQLRKATEATKIEQDGPSAERKTAKDFLRNKTNLLIKKLAGSKVSYSKLPLEVQALINFTPLNSRMNTEAYTNKSNAELAELTNKVIAEIDRINTTMKAARNAEKVKATALRKLASLQKREAALLEREAKVKERAKAIKEGTNLRGKIHISYEAKVAKESFTITGPSKINSKLQAILDRTWDKTTTSKVKYMADSLQTIQNVHTAEEFYTEHAGVLSNMTLSEIEDITDWLIKANINTTDTTDSAARQTFEAVRFFMLAYIYNETGAEKMFVHMNNNLKTQLGEYLKSIQTTAGTLLSLVNQVKGKLNPAAIIARELFANFSYQLTEAEEDLLNTALSTGDTVAITKVLHDIKQNALATFAPTKASALRKIVAIRSMSMTSSPMTWIRNITSNYVITNTNRLSAKIGALFFPKLTKTTELTPQYKLDKPVTPEIQDFITKQFIESGFFEETLDQLSKYNPSQVLRHKKVDSNDIIENMLIHAIYNEYYTKEMFDSKLLNNIHQFLMKRLSDKNFVREAAVRYLGKLLAETGHHLDANGQLKTTMDKDVTADVAKAFGLAAKDYMHSDNAFSHLEKWLSEHSTGMWAVYKAIMPFATASWNWFKAATKYTPVGLGQAIVKLTRVEQEIAKQEALWQKGDSQIDPALTSYIITRDLGSGIIGTLAFGFGAILAALGYISLEDDDWGTPKLQIGNLRIDVSTIFGSSSALAGAAFIKTLQQKDLESALDAMIDPLVDGFFFTDLLLLDANAPKGWFEWTKYQLQSIALSFIPSMVRYVSGATYTGTYKTNTMFERAVTRLPFLGQAFNVPKRTNVYTGDTKGTMWDIVHRMLPYFEITTKSQTQITTEMYGLNKDELHGTYTINGLSFKTSTKETARINKLYGELNADDLTAFYANEAIYRVLTENNKYVTKRYSQMTPKEISNALDQIFSKNSNIAKISAWLASGHSYYTNDREIFNMMRKLGYTKVYIGNKGFVN